MHEAREFLQTLTMVLCVAAVTTVVFRRLHQPVILGYLLAGMLIGPYIPVPWKRTATSSMTWPSWA